MGGRGRTSDMTRAHLACPPPSPRHPGEQQRQPLGQCCESAGMERLRLAGRSLRRAATERGPSATVQRSARAEDAREERAVATCTAGAGRAVAGSAEPAFLGYSVREGQATAADVASARGEAWADLFSCIAGGRHCQKGEPTRADATSCRAGASSREHGGNARAMVISYGRGLGGGNLG